MSLSLTAYAISSISANSWSHTTPSVVKLFVLLHCDVFWASPGSDKFCPILCTDNWCECSFLLDIESCHCHEQQRQVCMVCSGLGGLLDKNLKLCLTPIYVRSEVHICCHDYLSQQGRYWPCNKCARWNGRHFFPEHVPSSAILNDLQQSDTHWPIYRWKAREKANP